MMLKSGASEQPRIFQTKPLPAKRWQELNFSQGKIGGFSLQAHQLATILQIGAGGIGGPTALAMVRKGAGRFILMDDDVVEIKNLTRQLFSPKDEGRNKAIQLARRLSREGFFRTEITALPYRFQEALELGYDFSKVSVIVCGVDNNPSRVAISSYGMKHGISVVHAAASRDGNSFYCAVQEPGKACFGCMFPHALNDESYPCNLPGIIDVLLSVAGLISFALDSILGGRHREWNLKTIYLDGSLPDSSLFIPKKDNCPLCGTTDKEQENGALLGNASR